MKNVQKKQLFIHDYPFENSYSTLFTAIKFKKIQKEHKWLKFGLCCPYPFQIKQFVFPKKNL